MIENIKDLERLLKLCRKQGVTKITTSEVSLELGELPIKHTIEETPDYEDFIQEFPDGPLTQEELTFFANGGRPEDNPYRKVTVEN